MISIFIDVFVEFEAYSDINLETILNNLSYNQEFEKLQIFIDKIGTDVI